MQDLTPHFFYDWACEAQYAETTNQENALDKKYPIRHL